MPQRTPKGFPRQPKLAWAFLGIEFYKVAARILLTRLRTGGRNCC